MVDEDTSLDLISLHFTVAKKIQVRLAKSSEYSSKCHSSDQWCPSQRQTATNMCATGRSTCRRW